MSAHATHHTARREFLGQLGLATAALAGGVMPAPLAAQETAPAQSPWDTRWLDQLRTAEHRLVADVTTIAEGAMLELVGNVIADYRRVHGTRDAQVRAVLVLRQQATPIALADAIWERYPVGEEAQVNDHGTPLPARHNPFYQSHPGASARFVARTIAPLQQRGAIVLVCEASAQHWAARLAERARRDLAQVQADVRQGLVPGAVLVPSGHYALARAQNAGCALLPGV